MSATVPNSHVRGLAPDVAVSDLRAVSISTHLMLNGRESMRWAVQLGHVRGLSPAVAILATAGAA